MKRVAALLVVCPKCKQRRFDTIARACERRKCGYVEPPPQSPPK